MSPHQGSVSPDGRGAQPALSAFTELKDAARNLLVDCAGLRAGQRVVILAEDPALGWYDIACPEATAGVARDLGAEVNIIPVTGPGVSLDPAVERVCEVADIRVFFARCGDQSRFSRQPKRGVTVMVYARTAETFGTDFGIRPHGEMVALKDCMNTALFAAEEIRITCPLGTEVSGTPPAIRQEPDDVTVRRFPMCMPAPMPARHFSGKVALSGFLTPTGSKCYDPAVLELQSLVFAWFEHGQITGFEGRKPDVDAIRRHYLMVSEHFDIDAGTVHSWHAGIHSGCQFSAPSADNPDLWSNTVFGHPGYLHFHTCGDYAPGEICWMIAQPTVTADGRALWADGQLHPG